MFKVFVAFFTKKIFKLIELLIITSTVCFAKFKLLNNLTKFMYFFGKNFLFHWNGKLFFVY